MKALRAVLTVLKKVGALFADDSKEIDWSVINGIWC